MWMRGGLRWLILAIALHSAVNAVAATLIALHLSPLIGQLVLVVLALGVLSLGWWLARRAEESGAAVAE